MLLAVASSSDLRHSSSSCILKFSGTSSTRCVQDSNCPRAKVNMMDRILPPHPQNLTTTLYPEAHPSCPPPRFTCVFCCLHERPPPPAHDIQWNIDFRGHPSCLNIQKQALECENYSPLPTWLELHAFLVVEICHTCLVPFTSLLWHFPFVLVCNCFAFTMNVLSGNHVLRWGWSCQL